MSDRQDPTPGAEEAWGFAPPPFNAEQALQRLQRDLRDLGLVERAGVYEKRGLAVARAKVQGGALEVACVDKPLRTGPRWNIKTLTHSAAVRDWTVTLKRQLAHWSDTDD
jgi:hypothetical protein